MAHLYVIRSCTSFVQTKEEGYGTHERIEEAINKRKYSFSPVRKGFNVPHSSEWHMMEYRLKKEVIPEFVKDLGNVILLTPVNPPSLWDCFFKKPRAKDANKTVSLGRAVIWVQFIMGLFRKTPFGKTLQPVEMASRRGEPFVDEWAYHIIIGWIPDIDRGQGEEL